MRSEPAPIAIPAPEGPAKIFTALKLENISLMRRTIFIANQHRHGTAF